MQLESAIIDPGDVELIQAYAADRSEAAFHELVRRHGSWVHSVARRAVRNEALAEEVTQTVFALLAKKAASFDRFAKLGPWLFRATRYVAADVCKRERRRRHHEEQVMRMKTSALDSAARWEWEQIEPALDQAVARLNPSDRQAILLRFYEQKSHAQVARALGLSESGAKMRVSRAIDKLRSLLTRRGVAVSSIALSALLLDHAVAPASAGVLASASAVTAGNVAVAQIPKGTLIAMAVTKGKIVAALAAGLFIVGSATAYWLYPDGTSKTGWAVVDGDANVIPAGQRPPKDYQPSKRDWREEFDEAYRLEAGQPLRRVAPPFLKVRGDWFVQTNNLLPYKNTGEPTGPTSMTMHWDEKAQSPTRMMSFELWQPNLRMVLTSVLRAQDFDIRCPSKLMRTPVTGDWVVRDSSLVDRAATLEKILREECGVMLTIRREIVSDEVIVARGSLGQIATPVQLYSDAMNKPDQHEVIGLSDTTDATVFFRQISGAVNREVINETTIPANAKLSWACHESLWVSNMSPKRAAAKIDMILANVARQTGLMLKREVRNREVWVVRPDESLAKN